jgi:hypothetical protein
VRNENQAPEKNRDPCEAARDTMKVLVTVFLAFILSCCVALQPLLGRLTLLETTKGGVREKRSHDDFENTSRRPASPNTALRSSLTLRGGGVGGIFVTLLKTVMRNPILILCKFDIGFYLVQVLCRFLSLYPQSWLAVRLYRS